MKTQSGVALITALLVVALGSLLATAAFRDLALDLRRGQTLTALEQGYQYARGLEAWGAAILADDYEQGAVDHRREPWAQGLPVLDVDGGRLMGRLEDLDGRFNLNNLVIDGKRQAQQIALFRRLLTGLGLNPDLADAVADWQDADVYPEQRGAEDAAYMRAEPAYRTANQDFRDVSELRLVAGVDAEVFERLRPNVAALPTFGDPTPINVNTAPVPVLAALDEAISAGMAEALYRDGRAQYHSVNEFLESPQLRGLGLDRLLPLISVQSRYFRAHGIVELGDTVQHYHALLERNGPGVRTLMHWRGL